MNDTHPRDADVTQFLTGDLPEPELERVASHLEVCPTCRQRLPERVPEDTLVSALRQPLQPEPCSAELECSRVLSQMAAESPSTVSMVRVSGDTASFGPAPAPQPTDPQTAERPALDRLPCDFGRYRVLRRLGQGGMGAVYLAEDTVLQRQVALKVAARFEPGGEPDEEQRFRREARAAAALQHEGICQVYDYGVHGGVPYITMACIEGRSLQQVLRAEKTLEPRRAVEVVRHAALALAAAHRAGVFHRDLKPANILLDAQGRPKVVDFGLARRESDVTLTRPGTTAGTPAYMSPEQISGKPLTGATDIYSLGVILYQLLTGRLPFPGPTMMQLTYQIVHSKPQPPSSVREGLDSTLDLICAKAMAKPLAERYGSMEELAADLQDYLGGTAESPRPAPPRRQKAWAYVGLAAAVLVVAGLAVMFGPWRAPDKDEPTPPERGKVAQHGNMGQKVAPASATPKAGPRTGPGEKGTHGATPIDNPGMKKPRSLWGRVDLRVWADEDLSRNNLSLKDSNALPLRLKDGVAVEAMIDPPAYAYIVWIDTDGEALPIYPWTPGKWDRPADEKKVAKLRLPTDKPAWQVAAGPPGMETLLMFLRETPLDPSTDLKGALQGLNVQGAMSRESAIWFENYQVIGMTRKVVFDSPDRPYQRVLEVQSKIRERLGDTFPFCSAVSFANLGK